MSFFYKSSYANHFTKNPLFDRYVYLFLFILSFFIVVYPLLNKNELSIGHDFEYHLLRIEALFFEIKNNNFFPKIDYLFFNGRGYASSLFYNDFLLYPGAILRCLGFTPETSYRFILYILHCFTFFASFFCAKKILQSSYAGFICAFLYSLCQYRLCCVHTRCALGEIQAIAFIPLIVFSVYDFFTYNKYRVCFIASFSCMMLSHTITFLFSLIFFFTSSIIFFRKAIGMIGNIFFNFISVLLLTSFYWMPFVEMYICSDLNVKNPWTSSYLNTIDISRIFYGEKLADASLGINFLIFIVAIYIFRIVCKIKKYPLLHCYYLNIVDKLFIVVLCLSFTVTHYFPWKYLGFFNMIQFPWRIFSFASFFIALAVSSFFSFLNYNYHYVYFKFKIFNVKYILTFFIVFITSITTVYFYYHIDYHYREFNCHYFAIKDHTYTIGVAEWLPRKTNLSVFRNMDLCINDESNIVTRKGNKFIMNRVSGKKYIDFPLVFYKGYKSYYYFNGDIIYLKCDGNGDNGTVRVYLNRNFNGKIYVEYAGTCIQKISFFVSIISFFCFIYFCLYEKLKMLNMHSHHQATF